MLNLTRGAGVVTLMLCLLVMSSQPVAAQYDRPQFNYGLSIGPGLKAGIFDRPRLRYGLWGEFAFGLYAAFGGQAPGSMRASLHAQLLRDDIYSRVGWNEAYILESEAVLLNPEVSVPLRSRRNGDYRWELTAGIGAQYLIGQSLGMHNVEGFFGGSFLDRLADSVFEARRKLTPFVTAGIALQVHRRVCLALRIRQDLQNAFADGREVTLYSSTETQTVKLSAMPTRLLLGFQIRLGKMPEIY